MRHIWSILQQSGSLWVAWVTKYRVKGGDLWSLPSLAGSWLWRKLLKLRDLAAPFISSSAPTLWNGRPMVRFSVTRVWKDLSPVLPIVQWSPVVWEKPIIPRNSFILWTIYLDRIPTALKLASWGLACDTKCRLCQTGTDSRSHLFWECDYSFMVAAGVFAGFAVPLQTCWIGSCDWIIPLVSTNTVQAKVCRLFWCAVITHIWRERCRRFYASKALTPDGLIRVVKLETLALGLSGNSAWHRFIVSHVTM
ncbi:hypothetical protein LINPERHAP1_LOCUS43460 [Linum perenne]